MAIAVDSSRQPQPICALRDIVVRMITRSRIAAILILTLAATLVASALAAKGGPGKLDRSFDGDGRA